MLISHVPLETKRLLGLKRKKGVTQEPTLSCTLLS